MTLRILAFFVILLVNSFFGVALMVVPPVERLLRYAVFACDGLMIVMALSVLWRVRAFPVVKYLVLFLFVATITLFYNLNSVGIPTHMNGLRQPLFLLSTLVVLYDIAQSVRWTMFERLFNVFLVFFAILQVPLAAIQFSQYGAGDMVGGTYGYTGGSGFLTQLVFLIAFYFIARSSWMRDDDSVRIRSVFLYSLFLLPCTLNETKISFVYLIIFIVLLTMSRRKIIKSIPILALGAMLIVALYYYYGKNVGAVENVFDQRFLERYLLYDPRENVDVPRFQKIMLMFRVMHGDILSILFGLGYGVFAGENILGTSSFGRSLWYFQGTRIQLQAVWIQGGLLALIMLMVPTFWFYKMRKHLTSGNMRRFSTFLAIMTASVWLYNEALFSRPFIMISGFMMIWIGLGGMERATVTEEAAEPALPAVGPVIPQGAK